MPPLVGSLLFLIPLAFYTARYHKFITYSIIILSFLGYLALVLCSGIENSPFILWAFTASLTALFLTSRIFFFGILLFTIFSLMGAYLSKEYLAQVQSLVQFDHTIPVSIISNLSLIAYWFTIIYIREYHSSPNLISYHTSNNGFKHNELESQNTQLQNKVQELTKRNSRLVKLYDNLKKFEIASEQKTEILAEAARILDIKNKQIRAVRDDYKEQSNKLEELHEDLTNSIRYAQKIQEAITPEADWVVDHFKDAFILYQPKDIVSGDFYWFEEIKTVEGRIKILIAADCTGHGVPGAFMTVIGHSLINEIVHEMRVFQPDVLLKELDRKIIDMLSSRNGKSEIHDGMDMVAVVIDEGNNTLKYAAAHNPLLHVRKQEMKVIKGSRYPVGSSQYRTEKVFKLHEIELKPDDAFYIFTDGFQDQFGEKEERKYMTRRFRNTILSLNRLPMKEQQRKLRSEFEAWKGNYPQTDDVLIIGFRV